MKIKIVTILVIYLISLSSYAESPRYCNRKNALADLMPKLEVKMILQNIGIAHSYDEIYDEALGEKKDLIIIKKMIEKAQRSVIIDKEDKPDRQEFLDSVYSDELIKRICGTK